MHLHLHSDLLISNNETKASPGMSHSEVITPTKPKSRAPGNEDSGALLHSGNPRWDGETPSGKFLASGVFQTSSHLPTPQSPGNIASYLTRNPMVTQSSHPDSESTELPTEFRAYTFLSSPPFRPHSIPTPEPSPLVVRSRSHGSRSSSQNVFADRRDNASATTNQMYVSRSGASTPTYIPSSQTSARPATPMSHSRPTTPLQRRPAGQPLIASTRIDSMRLEGSTAGPLLYRVKDEPGIETARICAPLGEKNQLVTNQEAESRRPDYFRRLRRLAPSGSAGTDGTSLTSDLDGQDGSLLWSSTNVAVIDSPIKGKQIALFQETSEESFEESLMAGGYGRYRSERPWKMVEDAEAPNQPTDTMREEELGSKLELTEEEKRKKARLAAFLDPPSSAQLFPVEIEGCGRVLMKVEPPEPQTPPKPTPKARRSRKRKKSADMKPEVTKENIAVPEDSVIDVPNWPDTEFPWRSRLAALDDLSSSEQEERLRYIESFLDRESDEDDVEEGHSFSSRHSLDGVSSRSPRPGRGKTYPLLSHSRNHRRGTTTLSIIPSDPADARTALLCKKSIRVVHRRLLRRQDTDRGANCDDGEVLCVCRGRDDGRPLVQCDACRMWYHLECIGIQSTSELGREEDPWFCANCAEVKTPPPVVVPLTEPTFVSTDSDEHGAGGYGSINMEGDDPPFLNAGLNPSPWARAGRPLTTPPRSQYAPHASGTSWDEPSSSSRGDPRTPQFDSASAFGDMVRVYGMTPGRSLEASSSTVNDGDSSPFDPTSTPSRGIRFGLPFTTPKDGRWGMSLWPGVRGNELFHTPKQFGDDGGAAALRYGQPLLYHGRVGELSEEPSGLPGLHRMSGLNNITPIERDPLGGLKRIQGPESPLGGKRSKWNVGS